MMSRKRVSLTIFAVTLSLSLSAKASEVVAGQYVVEINEASGLLSGNLSTLNRTTLARTLGGSIVDQIRPNMFVIQRDTKETTTRALSLLRENVAVKAVDPNYIIHALRTPNDSDFFTKTSRTFLFWAAFIITRPLGAVVGDLLDKPVDHGGLALSRYSASAALFVFMVACLLVFKSRAAKTAH